MSRIVFLLCFLAAVVLCDNSAELFDCSEAGDFDISVFYELKEKTALARSRCMQNSFKGEQCTVFFSLSSRLILEEFKVHCSLASFLDELDSGLEKTEADLKESLEDINSAIGSDPLFSITEDASDTILSTVVDSDPDNYGDSSMEGKIRSYGEDNTRYTSDAERAEFVDALQTFSEQTAEAKKNAFDANVNTKFASLHADVFEEEDATNSLKQRILSAIDGITQMVLEKRANLLQTLDAAEKEQRKRILEFVLGSGVNGVRSRGLVWSAVLDNTDSGVMDHLLEIVDEAFNLSVVYNNAAKDCSDIYHLALTATNGLDKYLRLQTTYRCLLQKLYSNLN